MKWLVHVEGKVCQKLERLLIARRLDAAGELVGVVEYGRDDAEVVHTIALVVPAALLGRVVLRVDKVEVAGPRVGGVAADLVRPGGHRWQAARAHEPCDRLARRCGQVALRNLGAQLVACGRSSKKGMGGAHERW